MDFLSGSRVNFEQAPRRVLIGIAIHDCLDLRAESGRMGLSGASQRAGSDRANEQRRTRKAKKRLDRPVAFRA